MSLFSDPSLAATNIILAVQEISSPSSYQTLAQVRKLTGPTLSATVQDTSNHSNSRPWRTRKPTLLDVGDVVADLNFIPTEGTQSGSATDGIIKIFKNRELRTWRITFPDSAATQWLFDAYVTKIGPIEAAVDGILTAQVTLSGNDQPTLNG